MNYSGIFHSDAESFTSIREEAVLTGLRVTLVSAFRYSDHIAICFAAAALCTVAVHYALMVRNFSFIANRKAKQKLPPLVPYVIPFIGSLPFVYLWNSRNFVCSSKQVISVIKSEFNLTTMLDMPSRAYILFVLGLCFETSLFCKDQRTLLLYSSNTHYLHSQYTVRFSDTYSHFLHPPRKAISKTILESTRKLI